MTSSLLPQRLTKGALAALALHVVVFAVLYWVAYGIRTEFATDQKNWITLIVTLPGVVLIQTIVFYYAGHCHRSWYSVSFSDLVALFHSATLSLLVIAALDRLFVRTLHPPAGCC